METKLDLTELLQYIDPSLLNYQEWVNVGMALKHEGYTAADWDNWSRSDTARYHDNETFKKWNSFNEDAGSVVTGGTIVQMAKDQGYQFGGADGGHELDWNDTISNDLVVVDKNWVEDKEIEKPKKFDPVNEITTYLSTLFESDEKVGYVTESYEKDGKFIPSNKGSWSRSAGELIEALNKCGGDIGAVLGDYNEQAGAWIRFNPLDGAGVNNNNVVAYRYALVESDNMSLEKQNALLRELELPIATLVYSGSKSLHAIVKVNAANYDEYRKRVDYLYEVCAKNGLTVDTQDRNPSRLSRLPGVKRGDKEQFIMATNIGKKDWTEWEEWVESVNDDLPDPESLTDTFDNLPELAPPLIDNILRQGHKMLIAGPSKAGKSFALIELVIAIAEGQKWLEWNCAQGKVLYVNLELDRASALHRFKDVYQALGYKPKNIKNIDIWNLRGHSVPMDKLAPKLIRRALKSNYIAVIIDPIYKVLTGDENSADQMAHFTNQFDKIATELGCAVIYCHHHSKGAQGGKRAMDRASGSGVFARDPDALMDLTELDISKDLLKQQKDRAECNTYAYCIDKYNHRYYMDEVGPDDKLSVAQMKQHAKLAVAVEYQPELKKLLKETDDAIDNMTAWRVDGTLREFPRFKPVNLWFQYPIHRLDRDGLLKDLEPDGDLKGWAKSAGGSGRKSAKERKEERQQALETAYQAVGINEVVTLKDIAEYLGVSEKTVKRRVKEHEKFMLDGDVVSVRKDNKSDK
jgi:RecA-family ATPase